MTLLINQLINYAHINGFLCNFSKFCVFFLYAARYYATPRHNHRYEFVQNGLKLSARLERKKSLSLSAKK